MGITAMKVRSVQIGPASASALLCLVLWAKPVAAVEFEPAVAIGVTYTDNVFLETEDEQDETIFRVEPGFSLSHENERLTLNADYLLQAFYYEKLEEDQIFHQYNASLRAAAVPENLFFEVGGSRSQSIVDPGLFIPQNNLPITANRIDRDSYFVGSDFIYPIGQSVAAQGSYRYNWILFDDPEDTLAVTPFTLDSDDQSASFSIDNYRLGSGLTWALRYNWQRSEYEEEFPPFEYQIATAELGVWVSGNMRVFVTGGQESAWDQPLDPTLEYTLWEAGLAYESGERLSFEFAAGERTFGNSFRGNFQLTFRRGSMALSYQQSPTTDNRNPFLFGGLLAPDDVGNLLSVPGSARRFIQERLNWSLRVELQRTSVTLSLFDEDRSDLTTAEGVPLLDQSQRGASIAVRYRLGAKTTARIGGSFAEREFGGQGPSDLLRGSVGVDYRLGAKTDLSLSYDYADEDGETGGFARDYTANTVSLLLTRRL